MLLKKLLIENYKSFPFPTEIHFAATSHETPILLFGGMNNSGKSSIVEAIHYCLYGVKPDKLFPDINRKELSKGNSNIKFELTFISDDNEEIVVTRTWSAGANENPRPRDLVEKLVIVKDGVRVSTQTQEIWQEFINSRIPQSITRFFFFDGEKIQEIAQEEHTEVRLKSSLEAVLGIEHLRRLSDDIMKIKQEERKYFIDITDADIELREKELEVYQNKLVKLQEEKKELDSEISSMNDELNNAKTKFENNFGVNPLEKEVLRNKEKRKAQLISLISKLNSDIEVMLDKVLPFALSGNLFPLIKKQIQDEEEVKKIKILHDSAKTIANKIIQSLDDPPPIFKSPADDFQKSQLQNRITNILNAEAEPKKIETFLNLSDRDAGKIISKIEEVESSNISVLEELINEKNDFELELKELEEQLKVSITSETDKELFNELQSTIESLATQIGKMKEEVRVVEESIIQQSEIISQKELELSRLYDKHIDSKEKKEFIATCEEYSKLLNNFIILLRSTKINNLKEKTLDMFRRLASAAYQISDIRIDENSYEISIVDREGHIMRKSGLSAGQKEIFAISLLWGLAQASEVNLPIIIDTPLSRLDTVHRENIVNNYFPSAGNQVIILSTNTEITEDYYNLLKPYLAEAKLLKYDNITGVTSIHDGYFWS